MKLDIVIQEFLINQECRGNSRRTVEYYTSTLRYFSEFIGYDKEVYRITNVDLNNYYLHLKKRDVTTTTLQTYIRAVRAFLNWCYGEDYTPTRLSDRFRLPKADRLVFDVLSDYEICKLLACFDLKSFLGVRNWCICALMLDCGLRKNEVVTLPFSHYRATDSCIIVNGKGNRQRLVPLGLSTRKYMAKYCTLIINLECRKFFQKKDGSPITLNTIRNIFDDLKTDTGIQRLHPHLLRHTFATRFIENGGDVFTLQQILGHSTLDMSKKYLHLGRRNMLEKYKSYSPLDNMKKPPRT